MPKVLQDAALAYGDNAYAAIHHHHYGASPDGLANAPDEVNNVIVLGGVDELLNNHYQPQLSGLIKKHRVVCIHGAGGAGKSTLAQAELIREGSPHLLSFQIASESDDALFLGLGELYSRFYGVREFDLLQKERNKKTRERRLLSGLNARLKTKGWSPAILLLDNCKRETPFLCQVIDTLTSTKCLITTRDKRLLHAQTNMAQLSLNKGWRLEERLQFLGEDIGDEKERRALANYLPYPLGLKVASQTIHYLRRNPMRNYTCYTYLSEIRAGTSDDLQTAVLERAMKLIDSKVGQALLQFIGHLSSLPIPYDLVNNYLSRFFSQESSPRQMDLLDEALDQLQAVSLVDTKTQSGVIQTLITHGLVQDVAKREFPFSGGAGGLEVDVIEMMSETLRVAINIDDRILSNDDQKKRLSTCVTHLQEILTNASGHEEYIGRAYCQLGEAYLMLGQSNEAHAALKRALAIQEECYGENDYRVVSTLISLSCAYGDLGYPRKQIKLLERASKIGKMCYRLSTSEVAAVLVNLGNAYGELGEPKKQKEFLERALSIDEANYGENNYRLASTMYNLGNAYGILQEPGKQKKLLERVLEIQEMHYGEDHFQVASTLVNLGSACGDLGDPNKQKELQERALEIQTAYYGESHWRVAKTRTNLSNAYGNLGDFRKKKELLKCALKILQDHFGVNHYDIAVVLSNLGDVYGSLGDPKSQKMLLKQALKIKIGHYGPDHYEVGIMLGKLAVVYYLLGNITESETHCSKACKIFNTHYGAEHAYTKAVYKLWKVLTPLATSCENDSSSLVVYVPQGRGARLSISSSIGEVEGLYACSASSCNIVTATFDCKAVMIHVDKRTSISQIIKEIKWVGNEAVVTIYCRQECKTKLQQSLFDGLEKGIPGKVISIKEISNEHDGILVYSLDEHICTHVLPMNHTPPEGLIRHPKEQLFMAVQKIEQILGCDQLYKMEKLDVKNICLFDGMVWSHINLPDLVVQFSDTRAQENIESFNALDGLLSIFDKLMELIEEAQVNDSSLFLEEDVHSLAISVASWLEAYLNGFDGPKIFKRNMLLLLDKESNKSLYCFENPETDQDKEAANRLVYILSEDEEDWLGQCDAIIQTYKREPENGFKKVLCKGYDTFRIHYCEREVYQIQSVRNKKRVKKAVILNKKACEKMRKGDNNAARNLFIASLQHCITSIDISKYSLMASAFFNLGRSEQRCGNLVIAKYYITRAIEVRKKFDPEYEAKWKNKMQKSLSEFDPTPGGYESSAPAL